MHIPFVDEWSKLTAYLGENSLSYYTLIANANQWLKIEWFLMRRGVSNIYRKDSQSPIAATPQELNISYDRLYSTPLGLDNR